MSWVVQLWMVREAGILAVHQRELSVARRLLAQSRQALELAQGRYDLGLGSIVELSQAQLAETSAEIQGTTAKYDFQSALAVLRYQAGILR